VGALFTAALNSAGASSGVFLSSQTGSTTGGTETSQIDIEAVAAGTTYNNTTLLFTSGATAGNEVVSYNTAANALSIQIATGASTVAQVLSAVNATSDFSAALASGASSAGVFNTTLASTFSGGGTQSQLSDLRIDQANFGTASQIAVNVFIDQQATKAGLNYTGGTLTNELVLEIGGRDGFEAFNFGATTTTAQIAEAINLVTDATGVTATVAGGTLSLESREYGSESFVSVRTLNSNDGGSFTTTDANSAAAERVNGTDVQARINGVSANGNGLVASLNTSTLDVSFSVSELLTDGSNVSFNIIGGGAVFQLGPDVVSNQQARLGIQNLNTARLGGVSGTLFELRSGKAKAVANDAVGAAAVVDEVISQVTQLRGRLGAFQKTALETNIFTLNDTLEALTEAESSIRDADFARESAKLVRAQILVQSGTAVLGIANQNPQNVLGLLR
jgi:flagellin